MCSCLRVSYSSALVVTRILMAILISSQISAVRGDERSKTRRLSLASKTVDWRSTCATKKTVVADGVSVPDNGLMNSANGSHVDAEPRYAVSRNGSFRWWKPQ